MSEYELEVDEGCEGDRIILFDGKICGSSATIAMLRKADPDNLEEVLKNHDIYDLNN